MGTGWKDGELHALRSDVWLEAAKTSLSAVWTVCVRRLLEQGQWGKPLCDKTLTKIDPLQTFFIVDSNVKDHKSARACEACYDTVFPLLEQPPDTSVTVTAGTMHSHFTLSGLKSMPSLLLNDVTSNTPSALMAIDLDSPKRVLSRIDDESSPLEEPSSPAVAAVRLRSPTRPKSYVQILEEFQEREASPTPSPRASRFSERSRTLDDAHGPLDERDEDALALEEDGQEVDVPPAESQPTTPRRENTARRHKRFSLPAVALQTSPVTARPNPDSKAHRFSLVLGKSGGVAASRDKEDSPSRVLRHSVVAGRLNELLSRGKD